MKNLNIGVFRGNPAISRKAIAIARIRQPTITKGKERLLALGLWKNGYALIDLETRIGKEVKEKAEECPFWETKKKKPKSEFESVKFTLQLSKGAAKELSKKKSQCKYLAGIVEEWIDKNVEGLEYIYQGDSRLRKDGNLLLPPKIAKKAKAMKRPNRSRWLSCLVEKDLGGLDGK